MGDTLSVAVLVGSLRRGSFSRKVARVAIALASNSLVMEIIEIGDLPLYNEDLEEAHATPPSWLMFRDRIRGVDGVLFVTPEYNRSVPAMLKNALDVGSRPRVESIWSGKPCAVISVSLGALGAFGANHHLRQSFVFLDMPAMQQPEAYIGNAPSLFDSQGSLIRLCQIVLAVSARITRLSRITGTFLTVDASAYKMRKRDFASVFNDLTKSN